MTTDMDIANEIAKQVGHRAFLMLGAKDISGGDHYLQFKIGRNAQRVTHVTVTLEASDTYTVKFDRVRGDKVTNMATIGDVYNNMLHGVIESNTGMYLSL